jgi:hypothetical protein
MFQSDELKQHFETSSTIRLNSLVLAEWNMNIAENISQIGNYRYRPLDTSDTSYNTIVNSFDLNDEETRFYTGATDADIVIDGGFEDELDENNNPIPKAFTSPKQKEKLLYSLEDCFGRFRPRSGINKLRYFDNKFSHFSTPEMSKRPRYYMSDRSDYFKYWSSYRTEDGIERGIANQEINGLFYIEDTAPYIVYKDQVPANRIVVKVQTNVGTVNFRNFQDSAGAYNDPFFGYENQTTPVKWKIQYLENNNWIDAASFDQNSERRDGSEIIGPDGYVELAYGLKVPAEYLETFFQQGELTSENLLPSPEDLQDGVSFLVRQNENENGTYYIVDSQSYYSFPARYGWFLYDEKVSKNLAHVSDMTSPAGYQSLTSGQKYKEFQYISGLRIVVETMNTPESILDLIELSPRLVVDLSDKTESFSITKPASDLGLSGLPVGQLLASVGSVSIFDYDQAFFAENSSSILSKYTSQNFQVKFYEIIYGVNNKDYFVPIKTMYAEGFPKIDNKTRSVSLDLRDLFFYFESLSAPQILIQNASFSYAVSLILDSIGFSNYVFNRIDDEAEDVIPYFFIEPDITVAQVLENLARSTQTAMFFDEFNNFVTMSKRYILPSEDERPTDFVLYGTRDFEKSGARKNSLTKDKLANIIEISSQDNKVYNDGSINYTVRDIQRSYSRIEQASDPDRDKTWKYLPAPLWEISATDNVRSVNQENGLQEDYVLTAIPLNSDLTSSVPSVINNRVTNNFIDLGDAIFFIARYNGYFFANGEIIKYDAVQFSVPGLSAIDETADGDNVWVTSIKEYQRYFSKVPFNGKMYPTGLVRIYSEPEYETISGITKLKNGVVKKHGRGQFGTTAVAHHAGVASEWLSDDNVRGIDMRSDYLFLGKERSVVIDEVSLFSNSPVAVFEIEDPSIVSVGDYVERYVPENLASLLENNNIIQQDSRITSIDFDNKRITLDKAVLNVSEENYPIEEIRVVTRIPESEYGKAGENNNKAKESSRNSLINNFLSKEFVEELPRATQYPSTMQSSALVINGPTNVGAKPEDLLTYVYKQMPENRFVHFGTRMRVIGKVENSDVRKQSASGASQVYAVTDARSDQSISISGGSGGIGIFVNPLTNNGYFFEILALSEESSSAYKDVFFYKVLKEAGQENSKAIPVELWSAAAGINTDDGKFAGQSRMVAEEQTTIYDLAVEYQVVGNSIRFFLYINSNLVGIVDDQDPLPVHNNVALFVRGSSRVMFENIYALSENYSQNSVFSLGTVVDSVFGTGEINVSSSFKKYAMSGIIQSSYLSGIGASEPPKYNIYFEEFGTIMRECAYFDVRYDLAYPALIAQMTPTFDRLKGYTVSGFIAGAYGAEFLIFNNTDFILRIGSQSGNYLKIQGVTFTQSSQNELKVDDFFDKRSNMSDPQFIGENLVYSPLKIKRDYEDIKLSRFTQGRRDFTIDAPYIQSQDAATDLMSWLTQKIMKPRKSVGLKVFANPMIQLGDIVTVDYTNNDGVYEISSPDTRFVVYHIEYGRTNDDASMDLYLSEVT